MIGTVGIIITACLMKDPSCKQVDPRTCHRMHLCQDYFEPVLNEDGTEPDRVPSNEQCQRLGMLYLAKPQGWIDSNPDKRFLSWRCGSKVEFEKQKEIDT